MTATANYLFKPLLPVEEKTPNLVASSVESVAESPRDLCELALEADCAATVQLSLPLLWWELTRGLCQIVTGFFTHSRCYLVTAPTEGPAKPLEGRRLQILEAILCGVGQKSIAIELGLAPSTIALNARLALEGLGVHSKPSRAHPLLMLTAMAARAKNAHITATLSYVSVQGRQLRVVSVLRPDMPLVKQLPPAELAVVRTLIEGVSYEQIARQRGTSTRTIANQITAVFRRMKVSGRNELLHCLFSNGSFAAVAASAPVMMTVSSTVRVWDALAD